LNHCSCGKREGLFARGINGFLSVKNPCLVLRNTGNNGGINGRDLGDFRAYFYYFCATFTTYMNDSIVSTQKITDLFIPQVETIESVMLPCSKGLSGLGTG
jgi:hypothetical protein